MREAIRQEILNQMWHLWATVTFFGVTSKLEARKKIQKFFDNINRIAGMQIVGQGINIYICYEKHCDRPGVHVHMFIRGINPIHAKLVQTLAMAEIGDSKVEPYNKDNCASAYVGNKYNTPSYIDHDPLMVIHPKRFNPALLVNPQNIVDEKLTVVM